MTPTFRAKAEVFLTRHLPKLVVSPTLALIVVFVYGFILWTARLSLTSSRLLPIDDYVGLENYVRLWSMPRWRLAVENLLVFGGAFVVASTVIGATLAALLDRRLRADGVLRLIHLHPMALSFIVTGVIWRLILDPSQGVQLFIRDLGFDTFTLDWIVRRDTAIIALVIAAVWQGSGFVMALVLAAMRGVDDEVVRAARMDGAGEFRTYWGIVLPTIRPVFVGVAVVLVHMAIKTFDLVAALTGGGPGHATDLPATFLFETTFRRDQIGLGSAGAMMLLMGALAVIVPYLHSELGRRRRS